MTAATMPGAEPWSHAGRRQHGALCLHGFTGSPSSMRGVAEAFAAAGFHVELPLLAGHGTAIEDMLQTGWADWTASADAAFRRLAERVESVVVAGLSMGGALALWIAAEHPEVAGVVCVNPLVLPEPPEVMEMVREMVAEGDLVVPSSGSDIAMPDVVEVSYKATPLPCLVSLVEDGVVPLAPRLATIEAPMLLMTAPDDHVLGPAHGDALAAAYGGPLERVSLDRSFHVATKDYDRELIEAAAVEFADKVVGG